MRKGSMGTSMGGGFIRFPQRWPEKNDEECQVCKAPRRFPCRDKLTDKVLQKTHATSAKQRQARKK